MSGQWYLKVRGFLLNTSTGSLELKTQQVKFLAGFILQVTASFRRHYCGHHKKDEAD